MIRIKIVTKAMTYPARAAFDGYLRFERAEVKVYQNLFFTGIEAIAGDALTKEESDKARAFATEYFDTMYTMARVKFGITKEQEPALAS